MRETRYSAEGNLKPFAGGAGRGGAWHGAARPGMGSMTKHFGQTVAPGVRLPSEGITRCPSEHAGAARRGTAWHGEAGQGVQLNRDSGWRTRVRLPSGIIRVSGTLERRGWALHGVAGQGLAWALWATNTGVAAMQCSFKLTGITPLLMHADDVLMADQLKLFRDSQPRGKGVKGDDRSPAWTWHTYVYHDGEHITWPSENMMSCIRWAANKVTLKGNKTYKELSQSGLGIPDTDLRLATRKGQIPWAMIDQWREDDTEFIEQSNQLTKFDPDISLFVRRASNKNSGSKNVRVRPRFNTWSVEGKIHIMSEEISFDRLVEFFNIAGEQAGLGDWRPSSKTPGPYGRFKAEVKQSKK